MEPEAGFIFSFKRVEFSSDNNPQIGDGAPDTLLGHPSVRQRPVERKEEEPAHRAESWASSVSPLAAGSAKARAACQRGGWTCPNSAQFLRKQSFRCLAQGGTLSQGVRAASRDWE